jgi:hypothetical protein
MSAWARRWLKFGGQGLMVSLLIHGGLLFLATAWVISVAVIQKKEPNAFATGAGGGSGGERAVATKTKQKPNTPKSLTKSASKITSKSASAQIALPEMPDLNRTMVGALSASSKGFGGGTGGGIGGGVGLGKGGKNFTGRAVMGMKISGANIAVYFDSSPSMNPYFAAVEKQIKEQFPSADVYRYFGVFNFIQDGEVLGARPNQKLVVPTVDQIYMDRRGKALDRLRRRPATADGPADRSRESLGAALDQRLRPSAGPEGPAPLPLFDLARAAGNLSPLRLGFRRRFQDRHDGEGRDFRRAGAEVALARGGKWAR